MKQLQTVTPLLASLQVSLQRLPCLALAFLLLAGLNCGTTDEEGSVETGTTEVTVQPTPAAEAVEPEPDVEAAQLQEEEPALEPAPQPVEEKVEAVEKLGPGEGLSLGSQAPAFELPDGDGKLHALNDYIGKQKVVLVFYRGGW